MQSPYGSKLRFDADEGYNAAIPEPYRTMAEDARAVWLLRVVATKWLAKHETHSFANQVRSAIRRLENTKGVVR